jgi:hypothetical protein
MDTRKLAHAEAPDGFEPPHKGFADLSLTTWVRRQVKFLSEKKAPPPGGSVEAGQLKEEVCNPIRRLLLRTKVTRTESPRAGNGIRTRDIHLGKVTLYQLSYSRL